MQSPNKIDEAFQIIESENETPIFAHDCRVIKNSLIKKKKINYFNRTEPILFFEKNEQKKIQFL